VKSALGIVLIVFGVLAGASAASMNMNAEAQKLPPAERLGQAIGGALCSLTLVGGGFFLALSGGKKVKHRDQPRNLLTADRHRTRIAWNRCHGSLLDRVGQYGNLRDRYREPCGELLHVLGRNSNQGNSQGLIRSIFPIWVSSAPVRVSARLRCEFRDGVKSRG